MYPLKTNVPNFIQWEECFVPSYIPSTKGKYWESETQMLEQFVVHRELQMGQCFCAGFVVQSRYLGQTLVCKL